MRTLLRDKIIADDSVRKVIIKVNCLEKNISLIEMQYEETKVRILYFLGHGRIESGKFLIRSI